MSGNPPQILTFAADGKSQWFGMADYRLVAPGGQTTLELSYVGEPPHGDSYHRLSHDGHTLPGWVWGGDAAFSETGRYFVAGWMEHRYERATVALDLQRRMYFRLPAYLSGGLVVSWPQITSDDGRYLVTDEQAWLTY